MDITRRLALALTAVIASHGELLECCNEELPDNGAGPLTEDDCVSEARSLLQEFKTIDARMRFDIDPERSELIAAIEGAEDAEAERHARDELGRFDAARGIPDGAPVTAAQIAAGLRHLAQLHGELTAPRGLLSQAAVKIESLPSVA